MIGYFNKKGALIKRTEWNKRIKARSYRAYREYDNGDILVQAEWHGVSDRNLMPEDRKIFRLTVSNMVGGKWVKDISLTEDFANSELMLARYEELLLEYTDCDLDDDFEFIEKGNIAEPIPVPKKKEPLIVEPVVIEEEETPPAVAEDDDLSDSELDEITGPAAPSTSSDHLGEWS